MSQYSSEPSARPASDDIASMDAAHQSLADALRITFRLLVVVMMLLLVLFALSGFQTVSESERGIKLLFGRITDSDVPPGYSWAAPFPFGELLHVQTGQQRQEINDWFGPKREPGRTMEVTAPNSQQLVPGRDGYLVTADGSLAHAWWTVVWSRDDPARNRQNVFSDDERELVRASVERGVVHAVASTTIEQLLRQGGASVGAAGRPLELEVRRLAQESLDAIGAGIHVEEVLLDQVMPPRRVFDDFKAVTSAEARAAQKREEAEAEARKILNGVAGEAHTVLIDLIDQYEHAIELDDEAQAQPLLTRINSIIEGEPVDVGSRVHKATGDVASLILDARQYRTNIVNDSKALAASFKAKLPSYLRQPRVFVATEWPPAYREFREAAEVEVFMLPPDASGLEILLNRDPSIARDKEVEQNRREVESNMARRNAEQEQAWRKRRRKSKKP